MSTQAAHGLYKDRRQTGFGLQARVCWPPDLGGKCAFAQPDSENCFLLSPDMVEPWVDKEVPHIPKADILGKTFRNDSQLSSKLQAIRLEKVSPNYSQKS